MACIASLAESMLWTRLKTRMKTNSIRHHVWEWSPTHWKLVATLSHTQQVSGRRCCSDVHLPQGGIKRCAGKVFCNCILLSKEHISNRKFLQLVKFPKRFWKSTDSSTSSTGLKVSLREIFLVLGKTLKLEMLFCAHGRWMSQMITFIQYISPDSSQVETFTSRGRPMHSREECMARERCQCH